MKTSIVLAATTAAILAAAPAGAALVENGGFEAGTFATGPSGWVAEPDGNSFASVVERDPGGGFWAVFGGGGVSSLGQRIETVAGRQYRLSFGALFDFPFSLVAAASAPVPGDLRMRVSIDGAELDVTEAFGDAPLPFTLDFTGSGDSLLLFQIAAGPGLWALDDVAVTPLAAAAVPEPAGWAMMIAGFGLVGAGLRARRRDTRAALSGA